MSILFLAVFWAKIPKTAVFFGHVPSIKGLVAIDRSQDPHRYTAAIDRELCARQARSQLLDKIYGGATGDLIAAFLKESHITPEERDRLRQLLDDMEV